MAGPPLSLLNERGSNFGHAKPFLRWAGSKRKQLHRLSPFWSEHHVRYVEPFAGSACLFFELAPAAALLGDSNRDLIEVYRVVRDEPQRLYRRLNRINRTLKSYLHWRSLSARSLDRETRALRFLYLNRNCFNGIYRTDVNGNFNVPMGQRPGAYFTRSDIELCSLLLNRAKLFAGDFEITLDQVKRGDFVYLDPPFAVNSRRIFRQYGKKVFDTTDISRLSRSLEEIDRKQADFLVSYADCKEIRAVASKWNSCRLPIRRHIAGFAGARRDAYEWLITNVRSRLRG